MEEHLRAAEACKVSSDPDTHEDPEDGLTKESMATLLARTNEDKVSSWKDIWDLIFPPEQDTPVSGSCQTLDRSKPLQLVL